ncbi:hypothetical protein FCM35_KLT09752 [Carex littledalei]|uniref:Uncharacterized protein n=1 Tax=Carex littledalei TaxID=544730 RepID=A0A833RJA1_9POAL|nr:hypothetical protein FCM35_KLT09752 [Carex littledalei]
MASSLKLSYQKLDKQIQDQDKDEIVVFKPSSNTGFITRKWSFRTGGTGRRWRRPRTRLRIASLKRVLRRKARVVGTAFKFSVAKVVKRFKEGKPYIADLFTGNYMFLQVAPSTMGSLEKSFASQKLSSNFSYAPKLGA